MMGEEALVIDSANKLVELTTLLERPAINKIVKVLLEKPNMTSHILELSRETGYHKSTISIYVKLLEKMGLVETWTEPIHEGYNILVKYKKVRLRFRKVLVFGKEKELGEFLVKKRKR